MPFEYCVTELPESTSINYTPDGFAKHLEQRARKARVRKLVPPPGEHWELTSFTANESALFMVWRRETSCTEVALETQTEDL